MAVEDGGGHLAPSWFVPPGEADSFSWVALVVLGLAIYGVVTLYAAFDRWAEQQAHGTPLAKTIPTMLVIALLYEVFPLGHFHFFLPLTAVLIALMADWSRFHLGNAVHSADDHDTPFHGEAAQNAGRSAPGAQSGLKDAKDV